MAVVRTKPRRAPTPRRGRIIRHPVLTLSLRVPTLLPLAAPRPRRVTALEAALRMVVAAAVPTVAEAVTAAATTNSDFETQPGEARINSGPLPYATPNVSCFSATPDS